MASQPISVKMSEIMQQEISKSNRIDKILVVGHPVSDSENIETLLKTRGMHPAKPGRREGVLPAEINAMLLKSQHVDLADGAAIAQINPGPIWNGLVMDLLMGNLDQEFWGWSDSQAIYLLDYWKSIDPRLAFLMVYESPYASIARAFKRSNNQLDLDSLKQTISSWVHYNEELLRFFNRNPEYCLLVHSQQIRSNVQACLQEVRMRIGAPISMDTTTIDKQEGNNATATKDIDAYMASSEADKEENGLTNYLAQVILQDYPIALQLYDEMQAVASLPLGKQAGKGVSVYDAWSGLQDLSSSHQKQLHAIEALARKNTEDFEKQLEAVNVDKADKEKENELLLSQLHQVQEELENHYLQNKKQAEIIEQLGCNNTALQTSLKEAENKAEAFFTKIKEQDAKNAEFQNKFKEEINQSKKENELLLLQLHQVQEELEQHYLQNKKQAETIEQLDSNNAKLQSSLKEAENKAEVFSKKTKEQEAKCVELQNELKERINKADTIDKQDLPKIEQLENKLALIEKQEANAEKENELLLLQLHQVQEELERYYHENQSLKRQQATMQPAKPKLYGAAERVKNQLAYKLGATMIDHSRSLLGWLTMVFALFNVALATRREVAKRKLEKQLPSISEYADAHEAERVKRHLSYRLGVVFIKCTQSPIGLFKLPWALYRADAEFQKERGR